MLLENEAKLNIRHLDDSFLVYEKSICDILHNCLKNFWEIDFSIKIIALNEDITLFKSEEFFGSEIPINNGIRIKMRISKSIVEKLLDTLGKPIIGFNINKLSELEIKILNGFCKFSSEELSKIFNITDISNREELTYKNFILYIPLEKDFFGKIIISIPEILLNQNNIQLPEKNHIDIYSLQTATSEVDITVGKSKMSLSDLKHLSKDDIVLLENSDLTKMSLAVANKEILFNITPDPALILNLDDNGDETMDNNELSNDLWDNIKVDVSAEFNKIKLSLGELKQISEGLVVDIGSVYENTIFLKVENKNVAKGELVIINDRYGVKIEEMISEDSDEISTPRKQNTNKNNNNFSQAQNQIQKETYEDDSIIQNSDEDDDDFNYGDFELDDEDI